MKRALVLALVACKSPSNAPNAGDYCRRSKFVEAASPITGVRSSSIPAHTYSIVARDPVTGDLGVAVQSHFFGVGALVAWAEPGVGAVATQSFVERGYGPRGLALMASGVAPADALAQLVAADKQAAVRQVGFVDAQGRAAAHTGANAIEFAGHHVGDGFAVQANLMGTDKVVPVMTAAFTKAQGDLAERMLVALEAAQAEGGDLRGCQSAALLVVSGKRTDTPWNERKVDLRIEDHPAPLAELRRLVATARAYDRVNQGDLAIEKADIAGALAHYNAGMQMLPDNIEIKFWVGVTLASQDRVDEALPLFRAAFAADPAWRELVRRLPKAGVIADTDKGRAAVDRVLRDTK